MRVLGPVEAIGVIGVLSVVVNALTLAARSPGPPAVMSMELLRLAPGATVGLVAGALLLGVVDDAVVQGALAVAVLAALAARRPAPVVAARGSQTWRAVVAVAAGAMTTTIGVNGPPLVLWLRARGATPEQLRATLAVLFLVAGAATVMVLGMLGDLRLSAVTVALGVAGVVAGHTAGRARAAVMAVGRHERLVTNVLVLSAVAAAASAVA